MYERLQVQLDRKGIRFQDLSDILLAMSVDAQAHGKTQWHTVAAVSNMVDDIVLQRGDNV